MKKRKKKWYVIFLLILFLTIELVVSNKVITVRENVIKSSQIPASFNDFKILQISDLHSEEFGKANRRLLRAIDRQDPDIIAITGDMINRRERNYRVFDDMVAALAEKYPIYYIVGNHEQNLQEETLAEMLDHLENLGVQVLDNEKTSIEKEGEAINLYGLWFHLRYL